MKKSIIVALAFSIFACSCGPQPAESPTQRATIFNQYVFSRKIDSAYAMFSSRIKSIWTVDEFKKFVTGNVTDESEKMMDNTKFKYNSEKIDGDRAVISASLLVQDKEGLFRMKLVKENNVWMIDSEIVEDQFAEGSDFYRSFGLSNALGSYCDYLSNAVAQGLWAMTSKKIKATIDYESFKKAAVLTGTGKTPKEEGFQITPLGAYADDSGNGIAVIKIINIHIGNDEIAKGMSFKLSFVLEDGDWKANFINITKKDAIEPPKDQPANGSGQ